MSGLVAVRLRGPKASASLLSRWRCRYDSLEDSGSGESLMCSDGC